VRTSARPRAARSSWLSSSTAASEDGGDLLATIRRSTQRLGAEADGEMDRLTKAELYERAAARDPRDRESPLRPSRGG
jgi:hypothetical protein